MQRYYKLGCNGSSNNWIITGLSVIYKKLLMLQLAKELGCFYIIFALTLTAHNICLTHIMPSILIFANALGYILSIKVEFVMRNMMSICLFCCI